MRLHYLLGIALLAGCGNSGVSSNDDARKAYLGLDESIGKAMTLGFKGFNDSTNANIPPESDVGDTSGMLTVTGQVDQGQSNNKTMNLNESMTMYSDAKTTMINITYATNQAAPPLLSMKLSMIPTGTFDGTLAGAYAMTGDLQGTVTLNLTFNGDLEPDPNNTAHVIRKPGTTHITGTATSGNGMYQVDVTK